MLDNNKCILTYKLSKEELQVLKAWNFKVIEVLPEMNEMTVKDIISGLKFKTINDNFMNEKVILFNNFTDTELQATIKNVRQKIKGGILAIVTDTTLNWKFSYLVEHLIEERQWYLKQQKGR